MATFKVNNARLAEHYCVKHISRMRFYTHKSSGGEGWAIHRQGAEFLLSIEDSKKALMAALTLSEIIYEAERG